MDKAILALALRRAGFSTLEEWSAQTGLPKTATEMALMPYLVGYELHRVQSGDTLTKIAGLYGTTVAAIETANPGIDLRRLTVGRVLVVPLGFSVVPEDVPMSWGLMRYVIRGLEARYPALSEQVIGTTAYGRSLYRLQVGTGPRTVYYNAAHHANEWITAPTVLSCLEWLLAEMSRGSSVLGLPLDTLLRQVTLYLVPMVNPDGVDLVVGAANERETAAAEVIALFPRAGGAVHGGFVELGNIALHIFGHGLAHFFVGGQQRKAHHGHIAVPVVYRGNPFAVFVLAGIGGEHALPVELIDLVGNGGGDLLHHGYCKGILHIAALGAALIGDIIAPLWVGGDMTGGLELANALHQGEIVQAVVLIGHLI